MSQLRSFGKFFLPGPTEVPHDLFEAMQRPVAGHRSPEVSALVQGMQPKLSALLRTSRPVYISTSSATGMMEAAITNLTGRGALCLTNGSFGQRFYNISTATGRAADTLEAQWGDPLLPEQLREALAADPGRYDLVTVVHSESSTGVLNPVRELAAVVREFDDVLIAVDAVSSLAAARIEMDEWGIDFLLTGSQKAVALPPGLAFAAASDRALERARNTPNRGFYFDLLNHEKNMKKWQTPTTPAVSLLFALERQLERIHEEGLQARWTRHTAMAERTWQWVADTAEATGRPLGVFAAEGYRSPAVTAIGLPEGLTGPEVAGRMKSRGFAVAAGYGKLKEPTFRIGHMGEHTMEELEALLAVLSEVL